LEQENGMLVRCTKLISGRVFATAFIPEKIRDTVGTRRLKKRKGPARKLASPFGFGGVDGTRTRDPRRDRPVF
jgi:hypothetical protein